MLIVYDHKSKARGRDRRRFVVFSGRARRARLSRGSCASTKIQRVCPNYVGTLARRVGAAVGISPTGRASAIIEHRGVTWSTRCREFSTVATGYLNFSSERRRHREPYMPSVVAGTWPTYRGRRV